MSPEQRASEVADIIDITPERVRTLLQPSRIAEVAEMVRERVAAGMEGSHVPEGNRTLQCERTYYGGIGGGAIGARLVVTDEDGQRYTVDIRTHRNG